MHRLPPGTGAKVKGRVLQVREDCPGYLDLLIHHQPVACQALPGQFVRIKFWPGSAPLLLRPFDIVQADADQGTIRLVVKTLGTATNLLRELGPGDTLEVHGPHGRGIVRFSARRIALLVRGVGAASVVNLAEAAASWGIEVYSLLSASSADRLVCRSYLEAVSAELQVSTDDGSDGYHGNATDLLLRLLARGGIDRIYTCGSKRFARYVQALDLEGTTEGYVFLEGLMACGRGDCHGCAVARADRTGYYLICTDGPHFRASEVIIE